MAASSDRKVEQFLAENWARKKREILTALELDAPTPSSKPRTSQRQLTDSRQSSLSRSVHSVDANSRLLAGEESIPRESAPYHDALISVLRSGEDLRKEAWLTRFQKASENALSASGLSTSRMTSWFRPWTLLQHIVRENTHRHGTVPEMNYTDPYHEHFSRRRLEFDRFQAAGSLCYLESFFAMVMEEKIRRSPEESRSRLSEESRNGGKVSRLEDVRRYLKIRNNGKSKDDDIFVQLYYCLRCGAYEEAIKLTRQHAAAHRYTAVFQTYSTALAACCKIAEDTQHNVWSNSPGSSVSLSNDEIVSIRRVKEEYYECKDKPFDDHFKLAFLRLVSLSDPRESGNDSKIVAGYQDYLWERLWYAVISSIPVIDNELKSHEKNYSIRSLAAEVVGFGPSYWDGEGKHPYRYFEILCIVGQYEMAIDYLARNGFNQNPHTHLQDTIHYALSLYHYGLLRVYCPPENAPFNDQARLLYPRASVSSYSLPSDNIQPDDDEAIATGRQFCLDLGTLLKVYVQQRLGGNASAGLRYLSLLRGLSDSQERECRKQLIAQLLAAYSADVHDETMGKVVDTSGQLMPRPGLIHDLQRYDYFRIHQSDSREILFMTFYLLQNQNRLQEACDVLLRLYDVGSAAEIMLNELGSKMDSTADANERQFWYERVLQLQSSTLSEIAIGDTDLAASRYRISSISDEQIAGVSRARSISRENAKALLLSQHKIRNGFDFRQLMTFCHMMVDLYRFFDLLYARRFTEAMDVIDKTGVIPKGNHEHSPPSQIWEQYFTPLHPSMKKVYYKVLIGSIECLLQLEREAYNEPSRAQQFRQRRRLLATADHHPELQNYLTTEQVHDLQYYEMQM